MILIGISQKSGIKMLINEIILQDGEGSGDKENDHQQIL